MQVPGRQRVLGHTRFLQYFFRRSRLLRPLGCWGRAGLAGLLVFRPEAPPRCCHGQNLASAAEFDQQHERAMACIRWYQQYVRLLHRLESGRQPLVIDLFSAAQAVRQRALDAWAVPASVSTTRSSPST